MQVPPGIALRADRIEELALLERVHDLRPARELDTQVSMLSMSP